MALTIISKIAISSIIIVASLAIVTIPLLIIIAKDETVVQKFQATSQIKLTTTPKVYQMNNASNLSDMEWPFCPQGSVSDLNEDSFCNYADVGDGFCDGPCNNPAFEFDFGDCCRNDITYEFCNFDSCECYCFPEGKQYEVGDHCSSTYSHHRSIYLHEVTSDACLEEYIGDGTCDGTCNIPQYNFDNGDCCGAPRFNKSMYGTRNFKISLSSTKYPLVEIT